MSERKHDAFTRRDFLRTGLAAGALIPVAGLVLHAPDAWAEEANLVTKNPAFAVTVQALQYKSVSDKPDQHCSLCQFYTPTSGGHGTCTLFQTVVSGAPVQGVVEEKGWCMSFAKKVT